MGKPIHCRSYSTPWTSRSHHCPAATRWTTSGSTPASIQTPCPRAQADSTGVRQENVTSQAINATSAETVAMMAATKLDVVSEQKLISLLSFEQLLNKGEVIYKIWPTLVENPCKIGRPDMVFVRILHQVITRGVISRQTCVSGGTWPGRTMQTGVAQGREPVGALPSTTPQTLHRVS